MSMLDQWAAEAKPGILRYSGHDSIIGELLRANERILVLIDLVRKKDLAIKNVLDQAMIIGPDLSTSANLSDELSRSFELTEDLKPIGRTPKEDE